MASDVLAVAPNNDIGPKPEGLLTEYVFQNKGVGV